MTMHHANPGERFNIGPLGDGLSNAKTGTLFKSKDLEVIRLILPAGKTIAEHRAPGEIAVQCIEGRVQFIAMNKMVELTSGTMLYLLAAEPHALNAIEDSSLLLFLSLRSKACEPLQSTSDHL